MEHLQSLLLENASLIDLKLKVYKTKLSQDEEEKKKTSLGKEGLKEKVKFSTRVRGHRRLIFHCSTSSA